jgi:hypothetical protein
MNIIEENTEEEEELLESSNLNASLLAQSSSKMESQSDHFEEKQLPITPKPVANTLQSHRIGINTVSKVSQKKMIETKEVEDYS